MKPEKDDVIDFISLQIVNACAEAGIDGEKAAQIAEKVSVATRKTRHGTQYIAKVNRTDRKTRLLREFNGRNIKELCAKYGISERRFYQLLEEKNAIKQA